MYQSPLLPEPERHEKYVIRFRKKGIKVMKINILSPTQKLGGLNAVRLKRRTTLKTYLAPNYFFDQHKPEMPRTLGRYTGDPERARRGRRPSEASPKRP